MPHAAGSGVKEPLSPTNERVRPFSLAQSDVLSVIRRCLGVISQQQTTVFQWKTGAIKTMSPGRLARVNDLPVAYRRRGGRRFVLLLSHLAAVCLVQL